MKTSLFNKLLLITTLAIFSPLAMADDAAATKTIAGVLVNLNHFPSADDKAALKALTEDESAGEAFRAVALAVHNIQHAATAEDKEALSALISNNMTAPAAKALAEIVVGINHMPSPDAKMALQAML